MGENDNTMPHMRNTAAVSTRLLIIISIKLPSGVVMCTNESLRCFTAVM